MVPLVISALRLADLPYHTPNPAHALDGGSPVCGESETIGPAASQKPHDLSTIS